MIQQPAIQKICRQIYRQFPEVDGVRPKVQRQANKQVKTNSGSPTYLLIFKGQASLPGNMSMPRLVRVVANEQGAILKVTTSR